MKSGPDGMPTDNWVIVGCGYVGTRLATTLVRIGAEVVATRTSDVGCRELSGNSVGIQIRCFSLSDGGLKVPEGARVVLSSPPDPLGGESSFAKSLPPSCRLIYLSTTGVFGKSTGQEVDDAHPIGPVSVRGQRRADVEVAISAAHPNTVSLRIPGIYGPFRGMHYRMKKGSYRLIGEANTAVSRIHVDDLVSAIVLLGTQNQLEHQSYVIGDDAPQSSREVAMGIAEMLNLPPPKTVAPNEVSSEVRAMLSAGRRIVPRRLKALGWRPSYPSWREGVAQAFAEEARGK